MAVECHRHRHQLDTDRFHAGNSLTHAQTHPDGSKPFFFPYHPAITAAPALIPFKYAVTQLNLRRDYLPNNAGGKNEKDTIPPSINAVKQWTVVFRLSRYNEILTWAF